MGNCNKLPRTNSHEEIKVNGRHSQQVVNSSNAPVRPVPAQNSSNNPYPRNQGPNIGQVPPQGYNSHPLSQSSNPAYRPPPLPGYSQNAALYQSYNAAQPPPPQPVYSQNAPLYQTYSANNFRPQGHFVPQPANQGVIQSIPISGGRPHGPNPGIAETKAITRYCRVIDEKVNLIPTDDNLHYVNFAYKSRYPAQAVIHYFVREGFNKQDNRHYFYANPETYPKSKSFTLPAGENNIFEYRYKTLFATLNKQLLEVSDKATYPLVIEIECTNPSNPIDSQTLINCYKIVEEHGEFKASVLKQVIKVEGNYRILSNFYGTSVDQDESECLICLTEARTVALLPCKHVCYCEDCAKEMQKKTKSECPVCRTTVSSYLKVNH